MYGRGTSVHVTRPHMTHLRTHNLVAYRFHVAPPSLLGCHSTQRAPMIRPFRLHTNAARSGLGEAVQASACTRPDAGRREAASRRLNRPAARWLSAGYDRIRPEVREARGWARCRCLKLCCCDKAPNKSLVPSDHPFVTVRGDRKIDAPNGVARGIEVHESATMIPHDKADVRAEGQQLSGPRSDYPDAHEGGHLPACRWYDGKG